jgi:hypothetical protein
MIKILKYFLKPVLVFIYWIFVLIIFGFCYLWCLIMHFKILHYCNFFHGWCRGHQVDSNPIDTLNRYWRGDFFDLFD